MITRWKILYVSDHFSSIHVTSARKQTQRHLFEMKPVWSETRSRTSDGFTNLILTGGLKGATSYSSPSLRADQYQESGHYAPFESTTCTIDMLLFFICRLYLIPSLLFPLSELGGSYSRPNLDHLFSAVGDWPSFTWLWRYV